MISHKPNQPATKENHNNTKFNLKQKSTKEQDFEEQNYMKNANDKQNKNNG